MDDDLDTPGRRGKVKKEYNHIKEELAEAGIA